MSWSFISYVVLGVLTLGWTGVVFANALKALFSAPANSHKKRGPKAF